ncbi:MAG: SIMPL domain-containing protein [Christiangramia sp.]|uniref:SIMPL domain-containing protein n=1 Tax=Christiangramia sp. TaxID=1931228 RepID=UPI0032428CD2
MKNVMLALALFAAIPLFAQNQKPSVSVNGEGTVQVIPDEVVIKSRIEHEGEDAAQVKKQNDQVVNQIIKYLKSQGVAEKDIETDYMNLNKRYKNYEQGTFIYVANQAISITLHDLDSYEQIMKGLLENGLNRIDGIQFESSEKEKFEAEARKMAVLDAKRKASELLKPLGHEVGQPISLSENQSSPVFPMYRMNDAVEMSVAKSDGQTIAPGELEIKITVNATFEIR